MIEESEDGGFNIYCDRCPHVEYYDEGTWSEMIAVSKSEGWRIQKAEDVGGWEHICPACAAEH